MTPSALDVFADIACPWGCIGHRRLRAVLVEGPGAAFAWRHRAFELQPQLPPRGRPMDAFLAERFGSREDAAARLAGVAEQAARSGVPYDASAMRVAPNTRLAHRAVTLARGQGFEAQALDALRLLAQEGFGEPGEPSAQEAALAGARAGGPAPAPPTDASAPAPAAGAVLAGIPASPGVAVGAAWLLRRGLTTTPAASLSDPETEWEAFQAALAATAADTVSYTHLTLPTNYSV